MALMRRMRTASAGSPVRSCSADQRRQAEGEADPDGEVDGGADQEERHVEVERLLRQDVVLGHHGACRSRDRGRGGRTRAARRTAPSRAACARPPRRCGAGRRPSRRRTGAAASSSARPPRAAASQNRKASRYEWKNWPGFTKAPAAAASEADDADDERALAQARPGWRAVCRSRRACDRLACSVGSSAFAGGVERGARLGRHVVPTAACWLRCSACM